MSHGQGHKGDGWIWLMFTINALLQSLLSAPAIIANDANSHCLTGPWMAWPLTRESMRRQELSSWGVSGSVVRESETRRTASVRVPASIPQHVITPTPNQRQRVEEIDSSVKWEVRAWNESPQIETQALLINGMNSNKMVLIIIHYYKSESYLILNVNLFWSFLFSFQFNLKLFDLPKEPLK